MIKKIDNKKQARYTGLNNARNLLDELDQPQYADGIISFKRADEAIQFLKLHTEDNEFEREASMSAIIKAIAYLEEFEKDLRDKMIEGIAEHDRKEKLSKEAHKQAQQIISEKIKPSLEKLVSEIETLNAINNYSHLWFSHDLENFVNQVKKATRV